MFEKAKAAIRSAFTVGAASQEPTNITKKAYRASEINARNHTYLPPHISGDSAIAESWDLMTARVRDMVRNNPIFTKALSQMVTLVIGTGINTYSTADVLDEGMSDFVDESDTWFTRWAEKEADADGEMTFWDMQRLSFQETAEVGNSFLVRVSMPRYGRSVPLAYQLMEWEQLSRDRDRPASAGVNAIRNGIEYNARGIKVGYHFHDVHPYATDSAGHGVTRIPASRVIHNYVKSRISADSGITWFAPMIQPANDIDYYLSNEIAAAGLQSLVTLAVKSAKFDDGGTTGLEATDSVTGLPEVKMGRPYVAELGMNDDVELLQPSRPNSNATGFIDLMMLLQAMSSKMSLHRLVGDASKANFASIKASHQDDAGMVGPIKHHQARKIAVAVREQHIKSAIGAGLFKTVTASQFTAEPYRYLPLEFVGGAHPDIQELDSVNAAAARCRLKVTTPEFECGRYGYSPRVTVRAWARHNKYLERYQVVMDTTSGQGGRVAQPGEDEPEMEPSDAQEPA